MKSFVFASVVVFAAAVCSCDVQSSITKRSVEKYVPTPTPVPSPTPTEEPIDPADILSVGTEKTGPDISLHDPQGEKAVNCGAYNRVVLNGFDKKLTIKGGCRHVMINGDRNTIFLDAATEIVINGHQNNIDYKKFVNGKKPLVTDNGRENTIEKASQGGGDRPPGS